MRMCLVVLFFSAVMVNAADTVLSRPIVSGNVVSVAADSAGNTYVAGSFLGTLDFNPGVGADERTVVGNQSGFVTRFNSDGTYAWTQVVTGSLSAAIQRVIIHNSTVYACGSFQGTNGGVGTSGTLSSAAGGALLVALDPQTGNAVTSFGANGAMNYLPPAGGPGGFPGFQSLAAADSTLYAVGFTSNALAMSSGQDGAVAAVDANTGALIAAFGTNGVQPLGGSSGTSTADSCLDCALAPDGAALYVCGRFETSNFGIGALGTVSAQGFGGDTFVAALDPVTGSAKTTFGIGPGPRAGVQTFGGSVASGLSVPENGFTVAVAPDSSRVYLGGSFSSRNAGIGGLGTFATFGAGVNGFILALDSNGQPDASFAGEGVLLFGGSRTAFSAANTNETIRSISVHPDGTLYVAAEFSAANAGFEQAGTIASNGGGDHLFAAISPNGVLVNSFGDNGVITYGGQASDLAPFARLSPDGNVILAVGTAASEDLGGFLATGALLPTSFVLRLDRQGGCDDLKTLTVRTVGNTGAGSLRAAINNAFKGSSISFDENVFDLTNSDVATVINLLFELPALRKGGVTIDASNRRVTLNGSAAGTACGLVVTSSNNTIQGLSIIGFTNAGVCIKDGAKNNTIGGDRALGTGPNGQGLRISNCGAAAVDILGAGTDRNIVKGVWMGLEANGMDPSPNLAGVLIRDGAKTNVIGGPTDTQANVISGNSFEGGTVSGTGSDDNAFIGNFIGVAAVNASSRDLTAGLTRQSVGNGSAGVFLSRGTQASRVGGTEMGQGNLVSNNGGSGIEVRAIASRRNTVTSNSITKNARGGIRLFDGSNDGIRVPRFDNVSYQSRVSARDADARALSRISVQGSSDSDGSVEVFNDRGEQGAIFLKRVPVTGGKWTADIEAGDDALNLTATFTDVNGNTSPFAVFAPVSADSDGDGIPDALEALAGTDPKNGSSFPTAGGNIGTEKFQISLNFAKQNSDSLSFNARVLPPIDLVSSDAAFGVIIGSYSEKVTLTGGKAPKGGPMVKLKSSQGTLQVTFATKGRALAAFLSSSGLTDATTERTGKSIRLPVAILVADASGATVYSGAVNVNYKATQGKSGKTKLVK